MENDYIGENDILKDIDELCDAAAQNKISEKDYGAIAGILLLASVEIRELREKIKNGSVV